MDVLIQSAPLQWDLVEVGSHGSREAGVSLVCARAWGLHSSLSVHMVSRRARDHLSAAGSPLEPRVAFEVRGGHCGHALGWLVGVVAAWAHTGVALVLGEALASAHLGHRLARDRGLVGTRARRLE